MSEHAVRLHAVFASPSDARAALECLADAGVEPADIEVRSSVPLHGVVPAGQRLRTRVPLTAFLGGLAGGVGFFLLASLTSQVYPLPTGGMPIVPLPPYGVVAFEGVAIGAILFTVATVLFECGLPGYGHRTGPFDGHLAVGRIVVSVGGAQPALGDWTAGALATESESSAG